MRELETLGLQHRGLVACLSWLYGPFVFGGVLDDRDHAGGHEPATTNDDSGAGHLGHFDGSAHVRDLYPASRFGREDVVGLRPVTNIDYDLYTVAFHVPECIFEA